MRYKFVIIIFVVILSNRVTSQTVKYIDLKIGSCQSYQAWFYKSQDRKYRKEPISRQDFGFTIGFFDTKILGNKVYFGSEFLFIQKGFIDKIENTTFWLPEGDGTYTFYKTRIDYLSFNPIARYTIGNRFHFNYIIGPYLQYQTRFKSELNYNDIAKDFNKFIFGFTYCAGLEYKIKKYSLSLEFFQNVDLTNVINSDPTPTTTGLMIKNNTIAANLTTRYYFKTD